ncbi:MAG: type II and III secretion system protein family protein [Kiloniellales bacterium]|nr:type II and III secretion system protein family protein [Kiloniellales bacterium]
MRKVVTGLLRQGTGGRLVGVAVACLILSLTVADWRSARAQEVSLAPQGRQVTVELNEGQLIRLAKPAASVFVANPAVADVSIKSPRLLYVFGTATGETSLFAVDEQDNIVANLRLSITHNLSRLNAVLQRIDPAAGITATSLDGGIVLNGSVRNATISENAHRVAMRFIGETEEVINQLAVTAPNQVNLRVRIAEVSKELIEQFGFNWEAAFTGASDFLFGIATGNPVLAVSPFGAGTLSPSNTGPFLTRPGLEGSSAFFRSTRGDFDINGLIDLLDEDNLITVLAEPNLTALSGETASFLAGGEFPIPVPQRNGAITIEFKKFGVSLAFTPTIIGDGRISMRVRPEVSQLSNTGAVIIQEFQIPSLTTRRAETTVELGSGQSFAIAGLMLHNSQQDLDRVPGLADLPVLGALFKSDRFEREESELIIIVTPYLVRPAASEERMALPTDPYIETEESRLERELSMTPDLPSSLPLGNTAGVAKAPLGVGGFVLE